MLLSNVVRAAALAGVLTVAACGAPAAPAPPAAPPAPPKPAAPPPPPNPAAVGANELGAVPVLMYHRISTTPTSVYDRTPQDFRAELERLANEGYVPVTATDYATGKIDIPAGKHPVVLTFDDGSTSQFTVDPAGNPTAGSAIQILLDVAKEHPDFRPTATLYVFDPPFGEPGGHRTLTWLHEHGFEIGDHTLTHPNLGHLSAAEAQHEIAGMQKIINDALPGVPVNSLALPLGVHPQDEGLAANGSSDGVTYHFTSVFLVGSNPAPSPFSAKFNPLSIPRIRSQGPDGQDANYGSTKWLDKLDADPASRYTSDGDPTKVSAPAAAAEQPGPNVPNLYRY